MEIKYVDWGLANYYGDKIEINKALKKDKKLLAYVKNHELTHADSFDLGHDLTIKPQTFNLMWFVIRHPKTWIDFFPVQIRKKQIVYDLNLTVLYIIIIGLLFILFKIY